MESSRAATPIQNAASPQKTNSPSRTPSQAGRTCSRNVTPPLPPLAHARDSRAAQTHSHQSSDASTGLTALPQRGSKTHGPTTFAARVFLAAKSDLLYNYTERFRLPWRFKTRTHGAIDLTTLQQMHKHVIQQKLITQVRALGERECWLEIGIGDTLREYCQIVQNLEYMEKHAQNGWHNDPFLITTRRPLEAQILEESGLARQTPGARSARHAIAGPIRHMQRGSPCSKLLRRLCIMLAIAIAVIVPFLVSVLTPGYLARIVVVCACIAVFATAVGGVRSKGGQLLPYIGLTLIYAAALIIFVGTTPPRYAG